MTKHFSERYEVSLLWSKDQPHFANNYISAATQLASLARSLYKDPSLIARCQQTVEIDVNNGNIRKFSQTDVTQPSSSAQWYAPHYPVVNPHKLQKVRRVCNVASKNKGLSLKDIIC